jgi:hypothetical protein
MKKVIALFGLAAGLSVTAMAAEWTGYIVDSACASKKAMWTNEKCAQSCLGRGEKAVFVTEEGKVYQVADQDKVKAHAGHKVTVSGTMDGDTIKVDSVKM